MAGLCRYEFAAPAWYQAQSGPIFVIVLRASCSGDDLCISASNLSSLPAPEQIRTVGLLQVYVYAHDVFASLRSALQSRSGLERNFDVDGGQYAAYFTVQNATNAQSDVYTTSGSVGLTYPIPFGQDLMGRYFTIGVRATMIATTTPGEVR